MIAALVEKTAIRAGINPLEMKRFVKFGVVGVIGAVVDFGILNLLRWIFYTLTPETAETTLPVFGTWMTRTLLLALASAISFVAAIISNFLWNRYWTYPDSRSKSLRRQFAQFFVVNFAGIFLRVPIVAYTQGLFVALVGSLLPVLGSDIIVLIGDNLAVVLAVGIVMFWNFFVNRYWTYADVDNDPPKAQKAVLENQLIDKA